MLLFELLCKLFEYLQNHIEFVIQNFIASLSKYLKGTAQVFKRDEGASYFSMFYILFSSVFFLIQLCLLR